MLPEGQPHAHFGTKLKAAGSWVRLAAAAMLRYSLSLRPSSQVPAEQHGTATCNAQVTAQYSAPAPGCPCVWRNDSCCNGTQEKVVLLPGADAGH
jgi:hypothetical protein